MSAVFSLQVAIVTALKAHAPLGAIVGQRVHDKVPPGLARPYVHLRQFQEIEASADCVECFEIFADIDVWSEAVGKPEASRAAAAVRDALHEAPLDLGAEFSLVEIRHRETTIDTADGSLSRARMTFVALVERA